MGSKSVDYWLRKLAKCGLRVSSITSKGSVSRQAFCKGLQNNDPKYLAQLSTALCVHQRNVRKLVDELRKAGLEQQE